MTTLVGTISDVYFRIAKRIRCDQDFISSPLLRSTVVLAAALILFLRTPGSFTHPQFWAEDGMIFNQYYLDGWVTLFHPSGYFLTIARIVAIAAGCFAASFAPTI